MTFSNNCYVKYNPKDSLVILIRNNALPKYRIISHDLAKNYKYKRCSTCQNVAQILIQYLAQDYSFTLPRILKATCMLIDVEARAKCSQDVVRQDAFPGRWPDIVANVCNFLFKMSQGSASSKTEEKGGDGEKKKDFIYVETNIREEAFDVLILGQAPILPVCLSEMTS